MTWNSRTSVETPLGPSCRRNTTVAGFTFPAAWAATRTSSRPSPRKSTRQIWRLSMRSTGKFFDLKIAKAALR